MMQNPLVRLVLLVFGAYSLMTVLKRREPFGPVLTLVAGVCALVIWMLRYNRAGLNGLYGNAVFKPVIDLVCQLTGEQPPVDASPAMATSAPAPASAARPRAPVSARNFSGTNAPPPAASTSAPPSPESTPLMLLSEGDFTIAAHQINQRLFGLRGAVDLTMLQLRRNLRMREKSAAAVALPPLGIFLLIGKHGLGKRSFALEIGRRLYRGDSLAVMDIGQPDADLEPVLAAAKSNPYQTFVLENIDKSSARTQTDLLTIVAGQPLPDSKGARVSLKQCCFFLLMHRSCTFVGEQK